MDDRQVIVFVPVTEHSDRMLISGTVSADALERLFGDLGLPEDSVLVIKRRRGARYYTGHTLDAETSHEFMVRFGEGLNLD